MDVMRGAAARCQRRAMSEQDQERQQVDEPQEDMELPDEQSEDVKGGLISKEGLDLQKGKEKW